MEEDSGPSGEQGCDGIESGDVGVLFLEQLKLNCSPDERTDFINFRSLLWRSMAQFPDRVEPRSRELSPLLLRFIRSVLQCFYMNYVIGTFIFCRQSARISSRCF